MSKNKTIFITGAAGFIGFHLTKRMLNEGYKIIGYDNLNSYYDINLKNKRLEILNQKADIDNVQWEFINSDLENFNSLKEIFKQHKIDLVINLAAQAGVRYSLNNPNKYISSNIQGFLNILECCREYGPNKLIFASSSSVYGDNKKSPFSEIDKTDKPKNIYGVTKKTNELMAYSYNNLFKIRAIGLRFFTVYGPWGRPDMAPMIFVKNILEGKPIKIFNHGEMSRDFTFIDDVIEVMSRIIELNFNKSQIINEKYCNEYPDLINIGFGSPTRLNNFIEIIEKKLSLIAKKEYVEMPPGDIKETYADASYLKNLVGNYSYCSLEEGIESLIKWYKDFYKY